MWYIKSRILVNKIKIVKKCQNFFNILFGIFGTVDEQQVLGTIMVPKYWFQIILQSKVSGVLS